MTEARRGVVTARREDVSLLRRQRVIKASEVFGLFGFLVLVAVTFAIISPRFLTGSNFMVILSTSAVLGIVATGQTFVIISGGFDLSVAGVIPLSGVLFAILVNRNHSVAVALLAVIVVGALIGVSNGLLVTVAGINPLIATLGMLSITGGLAFSITDGLAVTFDRVESGVLADTRYFGIPNQVWLVIILVLVGMSVLRYTVFGRMVYALGGNREASWLAGIRVNLITTAVYAMCSALASFAGVVLASQLLSGSGSLGSDAALTSIAAVILGGGSLAGGMGSIWGSAVGVLILGTVANGMAIAHVASFYQTIATGVILLIAVGLSRLREVLSVSS